LTLVPVFLAVIFYRRREVWVRSIAASGGIIGLSAISSGAPILFTAPLFPERLSQFTGTLSFFGGLASGIGLTPETKLLEGLGYIGTPVVLLLILLLFLAPLMKSGKWIPRDIQSFFSLSVVFTLIFSWILASIFVDKSGIYIAFYLMSITSFLPLGILGLSGLTSRAWLQILTGWVLVVTNLVAGPQFLSALHGSQNYASFASSDSVQRKLEAAKEIDNLLGETSFDTRVLVDSSSIFPRSSIDRSASIILNFGNLDTFYGQEGFDYIVLDSGDYFGKPNPIEDAARDTLFKTGVMGGVEYKLVYAKNGTLLYKSALP
jgi:hypothetical protein